MNLVSAIYSFLPMHFSKNRITYSWIVDGVLPIQCCASAGIICRPVFVCVSVTCWYCIKTAAAIELVLYVQVFPNLCYTVF